MFRRARKRVAKARHMAAMTAATQHIDDPLTTALITELQQAMTGHVVQFGDSDYDASRQLSNNAFQLFPQAIAYCETFADVRACLDFAYKHRVALVPRSGGHNTAGFSVNDGLVIDVSRLAYVVVDPERRQAVVGAGTNFGHLNAALDDYRLHVPSGGCEDVCVGGYMQGGGFGFTSREYGMNCDNVVEALVMLADGGIVKASESTNAPLFWAIRGGTGNNFGIVLQVTYELHDLWQVWGFGLRWPIAQAAEPLALMQRAYMRSGAPAALGYMTFLVYQHETPDKPDLQPYLLMRGMYHGDRMEGLSLLDPLMKTAGASLQIDQTGSYRELNQSLLEQPDAIPLVPDIGREDKQSGYIARPLEPADWQRVIDAFLRTPNQYSVVCIEPYGGAISARAPDFNAFVHRQVDMDLFLDVFWIQEPEEARAKRYLDEFVAAMQPYFNGESYQNYPRRGLPDYLRQYFGSNLARLIGCKNIYDPDYMFRFPQGIPLTIAGLDASAALAAGPAGTSITYESYSPALRASRQAGAHT
jgi:FAD/FMN-containing dehydrogenase